VEKAFKILTIDGGGARGQYSASALAEFERSLGPIAEHFDLLCGTSTGGLIALALASGRTAAEITDFYSDWGPKIFPEPGFIGRMLRKRGIRLPTTGNTDAVLGAAVDEILGDKRVRDSNSYLCIPTLDLHTFAPYVFKTDHDATLSRDSDVLMRDVAMATSAAPFYFPVAEASHIRGSAFVDGGLWANNPSVVGLVEAGRFFVGEGKRYDSAMLLSLASITPASGKPAGLKRRLGLLTSGLDVLKATLESQQASAELSARFLARGMSFPVEYVRIASPPTPPSHADCLALDSASPNCLDLLRSYGRKTAHAWHGKDEVRAFFQEAAEAPVFYGMPAKSSRNLQEERGNV
jgi:hypothetical protein